MAPSHTRSQRVEHWIAFTSRISALRDASEICRALAQNVARASGATTAAVYLTGAGERVFRLSASVGDTAFVSTIDEADALPSWLRLHASPAQIPVDMRTILAAPDLRAALVIAIPWRGMLLGFVVVGAEEVQVRYAAEDIEFLRAVAEQTAATIMAVRLAEAVEHPKRVESSAPVTTEVIHDIKNSVSALSILAHNATKHLAEPEFQRDAINTLSRTVERMQRLLGKLAAREVAAPLRPEPIDLQELIIQATTPLIGDGKVRLVKRLRPVNSVYGDRDALLRVVENLTTNASEAIEREGTITVTLAEEGGYAVISIADDGCGIPDAFRERHLFSPFHSTKQGGWGIGLYQTKQAVESQDGEILVESLEGRGTTFTVKLPLRTGVETDSLESVR